MRQAGEVTYADTNKGRKNEGVIEFRQYSDMKRALEKLDGTEVNGRKIRLIEDRPGARRRRSYSRSASRCKQISFINELYCRCGRRITDNLVFAFALMSCYLVLKK